MAGWDDLAFWSRPIGSQAVYGSVDELGNPAMQDYAGNVFSLTYGQQPEAPRPAAQPVPEGAGSAMFDMTGLTPYEATDTTSRVRLGDVLRGLWGGITAPARAARGEPVTYGDAFSTALDGMGGGAFSAIPEGAIGANAIRDPRLWHDASRIKLARPVDEMEFGVLPTGSLEPSRALDIADLQGRTLIPAFGDRTRAGAMIESINGQPLDTPVLQQGGVDFMREQGAGVWASEPNAMRSFARRVNAVGEAGESPVLAYTAMGAQAGDFSTMMSDAVMGQIPFSRIMPDAAARYDDYVRAEVDPSWPGILSPEARDYIGSMTGSNRRLLWQEMDRSSYRDSGFPDVGATRLAITDPSLLGAQPFDTGRGFAAPDISRGVISDPAVPHLTYGAQIDGDYLGRLEESIPGEMVWRDFFRMRRESGASPASDQRAFMMRGDTRQRVDQQMVDDVSQYLEQWRAGPR